MDFNFQEYTFSYSNIVQIALADFPTKMFLYPTGNENQTKFELTVLTNDMTLQKFEVQLWPTQECTAVTKNLLPDLESLKSKDIQIQQLDNLIVFEAKKKIYI